MKRHIQHSRNPDRDMMIKQLAMEGKAYREIGKLVGNLTGQRVKQIIDGYGWERPGDVRRKERNNKLAKEKKAKFGEYFVEEMRQDDFYKATRQKFTAKKANASRNGIEFTVEYGDLEFPLYCPMLKFRLNYFSDKISNESPSFDRIDPTKGYTKENTIICSFLANKIKTDATSDEIFKVWRWLKDREEEAKL